jgi:hypothetical protein
MMILRHSFIISMLLVHSGLFAQVKISFMEGRVTPSDIHIRDLSSDGRYVLFNDDRFIFIYDIIAEDYKAILQQSKSTTKVIPLAFIATDNRILVEKSYGGIKSGWGEIVLDYRTRTASAVMDLPMTPVNKAHEYEIRIFDNIMITEEYLADTLVNLTAYDATDKTPIEKINDQTKEINTPFEDCENFRRFDYVTNAITGEFLLIEEYYRRSKLRLSVTTFRKVEGEWKEVTATTLDTERNILPCQLPRREYYLSEDGTQLMGFIQLPGTANDTELCTFDLEKDKKIASIIFQANNKISDSVYREIHKLGIASRKKKCYSKLYANQNNAPDFEFAFVNDSGNTQKSRERLITALDKKINLTPRITRDACIFKSNNGSSTDSLYHLDYKTGIMSAFPLEKVTLTGFNISQYNSYKKIRGTSFDVVTRQEETSNPVDADCFKRIHGKFQGLHIVTDSNQADSLLLNCSNNYLAIYKDKKRAGINLTYLFKELKKYYKSLPEDSIAKRVNTIYLRRLSNPLAHLQVTMKDTSTFFLIWNVRKNTLQGQYKFQQHRTFVRWPKGCSKDSIFFFLDRQDMASTQTENLTLRLVRYDFNAGLITPWDSVFYPGKHIPSAIFKDLRYDYSSKLALLSIFFPEKGTLLYDAREKKVICSLDYDPRNFIYEDFLPVVEWFRRHQTMRNLRENISLAVRAYTQDDIPNQFLYVNPDSSSVTVLNGSRLLELPFRDNEVKNPRILNVDGELWSYDFDRNFMIFNTGPETFSLYTISPAAQLLRIHFERTKVRFTMLNGGKEYTEIYTINNKSSNYFNDPKFDRPDTILTILGCKDTRLKYVYREIVKLRQARFNAGKTEITPRSVPEADISNFRDLLKTYQNQINPRITYTVSCDLCTLKRYNVWVNGIPLYGDAGNEIKGGKKTETISERIPLSEGRNEIEFSAANELGIWSTRARYVSQYNPVIRNTRRKIFFAGIGMSKYQDSTRTLNSSDKDIRVLHQMLTERYKEDLVMADTLINVLLLKKRFADLKQALMNSDINDKVIVMLSGHGLLSSDKLRWHFATFETDFRKPDSTATITFDDINNLMDGIPARNRFIIIDACHAGQSFFEYSANFEVHAVENTKGDSGPTERSVYPLLDGFSTFEPAAQFSPLDYEAFKIMTEFFPDFIQNGSTVLTASRGEQTAKEDGENGLFTKALVEVLKKSGKGTLTINKLIEEINERFSHDSLQKPSVKSYNQSLDWLIW